jgi:predicted component of type VI protein secretion system
VENPTLTLKIELLGGLVQELSFWASLEDGGEYGDQKFDEVLSAAQEMRVIVLDDIEEYLNDCKVNNEPVCLNYFRVRRELQACTFEKKRF